MTTMAQIVFCPILVNLVNVAEWSVEDFTRANRRAPLQITRNNTKTVA